MKLVTRADFGWPPTASRMQTSTKGVKVHYEGTHVDPANAGNHNLCVQEWRDIRASHLANTKENYSDIAYNFGVCYHGIVFEGRGVLHETGANGNQDLNHAHYAVCGLLGSSGLTEPSVEMLDGIRDAIDFLRLKGAGPEIKGHRDGYATECPGQPLYDWVLKGAPRSIPPAPVKEDDMPNVETGPVHVGFLADSQENGTVILIPPLDGAVKFGVSFVSVGSDFGELTELRLAWHDGKSWAVKPGTVKVPASAGRIGLNIPPGVSKVSLSRVQVDPADTGKNPVTWMRETANA